MNAGLILMPLVILGGVAAPVDARQALVDASQSRQLEGARGRHVAVIDDEGCEWEGRLIEVGKDALTVELNSARRQFPIDVVKRVDADGDRVVDGIVKGAIFGGALGLVVTSNARAALSGAMLYGLIGAGVDALHNCRHTVYRAPAATATVKVSW